MPHLSPQTLTRSEQKALLEPVRGQPRDELLLSMALGRLRAGPRESDSTSPPPPSDGNQCPHRLNDSKRPCSLKKAVDRTHDTRPCECQDEPAIALLEGVEEEHGGNCE